MHFTHDLVQLQNSEDKPLWAKLPITQLHSTNELRFFKYIHRYAIEQNSARNHPNIRHGSFYPGQ